MGRWRGFGLTLAAIVGFASLWGCSGHPPAGTSPYPTRVSLNPGTTASLQLGGILTFSATAQNGTGTNLGSLPFTYNSNNTSVLTLSPTGVACAGQWDSTYSLCTPGAVGVVQVTATVLGLVSAPTFVFVHAPVDNIVVKGILLNNQAVQEPCLSQGQTMIVEAHAFSQGSDITSSVGPFSWSANNASVVTLTPIVSNFTYNVATNQATAKAITPGITQIFASASGVTSISFTQPPNAQGQTPPLDFFETCPIQNISLYIGTASSQSGQTTFVTAKGGSAPVVQAVVTDVMGDTSVVGSNTPVLLSKIPLTWSATQPQVVGVSTGCQLSCTLTVAPGAGSVTASCSPPTCNIGYPVVPAILTAPNCPQLLGVASCQQFIPLPVYAAISISGIVTGASAPTSILATSTECAFFTPLQCTTAIYSVGSSRTVAGPSTALPSSPTSLRFSLAGDRAYMGSQIGAVSINPANIGSGTSPFSSVGAVTGKILAVSDSGTLAVFSDTTLTPNQVFVVNTGSANATVTPLNIRGATTAAFSPDGLKAFIFGFDNSGNPTVFVYSTVRGLQTLPALPARTTVNGITFSTDGAFVYVVEPSLGGGGAAFTVYNMCDNAVATSPSLTPQSIPLAGAPISFKALPDGVHFVALESGGTLEYIAATVTAIPAATVSQPATSICPMHVSHTVNPVSLSQGTLHPIDFFTSADGTLLYVVASDRSFVAVYDFLTGGTTGIPLAGNALPVQVGMSADAGTIVIAANDGKLHQLSTALGGDDLVQTPFPDLPNYLNPFCTNPAASCVLDLIAVKP